jgi:hypothetical protein
MVAQVHETAEVRDNGEGDIFAPLAHAREEGNGHTWSGRQRGLSSSCWAADCDARSHAACGGHAAALPYGRSATEVSEWRPKSTTNRRTLRPYYS